MKSTSVYVSLAIGCAALGVLTTWLLLLACQYFKIDIAKNLWLITIPIVFSIFLNILFIELYSRYKKK